MSTMKFVLGVIAMDNEKKSFIKWIRVHKKELIITGISSATIIGIIIGIKNKDSIIVLWESLKNRVKNSSHEVSTTSFEIAESIVDSVELVDVVCDTESITILPNDNRRVSLEVCEHIRNLSNGRKASAKKIATAAEHGYNLRPGQTWVETYTKGICVA